jgi:uncharacterized protein (DUF488 family)
MTIYTFGYHRQSLLALAAKLDALDATLIDIRRMPRSRTPDWGQGNLTHVLRFRYQRNQALGNRFCPEGSKDVLSLEIGINRLERYAADANRAPKGPLVLMCRCERLMDCHRAVVADALRDRGHIVTELVL